MSEKKWLIILGIVNLLAIAGIVVWYVNRDNNPPVITQEEEIIYEEAMSDSELLEGAAAYDETDGDVSDTLVVEKVTINQKAGIAMVTCGAMDSSGNIAKQSFRMTMRENSAPESEAEAEAAGNNDVFTLAVGEAANGNEIEAAQNEDVTENDGSEESTEEAGTEETDDSENADNEENVEEPADTAEQEAPAENANAAEQPAANEPQAVPEAPILNFGAPEVKTKKGQNPAWVSVISQLQDNKDSYEALLKNLKITGEFTNANVGNYDVMVSTVDSDGNESEARAIRITVEE